MTSWIFLSSLVGLLLLLAGFAAGFLASLHRAAGRANSKARKVHAGLASHLPSTEVGPGARQAESPEPNPVLDQLQVFQELCQDLLAIREQSIKDRTRMEDQLRRNRELMVELEKRYRDEYQDRLESHQQLQQQQEQNSVLRFTIGEMQDEMADSRAEVEQVRAEERTRGDRLAEKLQDAEESLADMTTCAENLSTRLNLTQAELVEATHQLAAGHAALETTDDSTTELADDAQGSDHERVDPGQSVIKERFSALLQQRDTALDRVNQLQEEMSTIKSQSLRYEKTIGELRREQDALRVRETTSNEQYPRLLETPTPTGPDPELNRIDYGGTARVDPVLGRLYTSRPSITDDLKKISGIATVLETKLNQLGIYTYEQVLSWDTRAMGEFSKLLSFKDRMARDQWQAQARRFYLEKYADRAA